MTRRNKCDVCRKAKVKCDENLPSCSSCIRRERECTRTSEDAKKAVRFVQVTGKVVDGAVDLLTLRPKESTVPLDFSSSSSATSRRVGDDSRVVVASNTAPAQLNLFFPTSKHDWLLTRWTSMMYRGWGEIETAAMDTLWCSRNWTTIIPRYIGTSLALDDAANCYLESKLALANPTDTSLLAVQTSKFKAVNSVRLALETKGSWPVQGSILLAVHLLYMVEALMMHSHTNMVTHVKGLIALLYEYKKNLEALDAEGNKISSGLFISTYSSGLVPALLSGENHDLDSPNWLNSQLPLSNAPIITCQATQEAWQNMVQSYVAIPRLARLIRHLQASPENAKLEQEAVDLAKQLHATTIDPDFLFEATSLGELWIEPTTISDISDIMPTSYRFKSRKLVGLLSMYWMARLLICGLVEKLISTVPSKSQFFDASAVEAEDVSIATEVFMMVQDGFTGLPEAGSDAIRTKQMQLLCVLQMAFGAWYRMGKRAAASEERSAEDREMNIQRAHSMQQLCLDLGNQLLSRMQLPLMDKISMETLSAMFAGGPIVQCDLPDA